MKKKYILNVYNTCTGGYEDVEVTKAVYDEYRRGLWRIKNNDRKHRARTIPFSTLTGGNNHAFENYDEFVDYTHSPEQCVERKMEREVLMKLVSQLETPLKRAIWAIYIENIGEREFARRENISQTTAHRRKKRALIELKKLMEATDLWDF